MRNLKIYLILFLFSFSFILWAQNYKKPEGPMKYWDKNEFMNWLKWNQQIQLAKPTGYADRREGLMDGNQIRTKFYNYGSIGRPNTEPSTEWPKGSRHGYVYEFGPLVGAEVFSDTGDTLHIFSDGLIDGGDRSLDGKFWGWEPLSEYLNPDTSTPAMSNNPDSWPQAQDPSNPFYNINHTGAEDMFLWPGLQGQGIISGDLESYWVMDDRDNAEFEYYPFINDSTRRGLGLELTCRLIQFSDTLAEDILFYIMDIQNVSDKRLNKVIATMFGDPHIGGPHDYADDYAWFDSTLNLIYSWDAPNSKNDYNIPWEELGWLGFKLLESPKDSSGNELGLTSMAAPLYGTIKASYDEAIWEKSRPGQFSDIKQNADNIFLFGSGYFSLDPGEIQRFSIAIIMGKGEEELRSKAVIAQMISDNNYQITTIEKTFNDIPSNFVLFQNFPNPFNPTTTIKYALPKAGRIKLEVFNLLGQKVATLVNSCRQAGYHQVTFDGSGLPSGVYYYRLQTDKGFVQTRKLVLLK